MKNDSLELFQKTADWLKSEFIRYKEQLQTARYFGNKKQEEHILNKCSELLARVRREGRELEKIIGG